MSTLKPGDVVGGRFKITAGPISLQGVDWCAHAPGALCWEYHCPHCREHCSMVGHAKCREGEQ